MGQPNKLRSGKGVCGTVRERKARFREVKGLVTGLRRDVDTPTHLSPLARGVLGLIQVGVIDVGPIAFYMNEDRLKVANIKRAIERSKNPIVVRARAEGLPVCASVKVLWGTRLRCNHCKLPLASVPCPKCAPLWEDHYPSVQVYKEARKPAEPVPPTPEVETAAEKKVPGVLARFEHLYEEPTPAIDPDTNQAVEFLPTNFMPGSNGKLDVLEYRASHGLPLWHPADRMYISTDFA